MRLVITGGHHTSALPVIADLRERFPEVEIFWFGHRRSMKGDRNDTLEYLDLTRLGIPFYDLKAGKFYKTYNIGRLAKIPYGFLQALFYLLKTRPDLIVSFGGYLAVPTVISGYLLGIPAVTHEQTTVAGYANRVVAIFCRKIMVSWESSFKYYDQKKVVHTGLPLRESIFKTGGQNLISDNGLPYLFILAGKTGSHLINNIIRECLPELLKKYNVIHQCGDHSRFLDYEALRSAYETLQPEVRGRYFLRKFIGEDEIGEAYHRSSVVLSRAGAHTSYELLALGKPCVLIPISWVSHREQIANAELLKDYGIARIIREEEMDKGVLLEELGLVFNNLNMYRLNKEFKYNKNAGKAIADEIVKTIKETEKI